MSWANGVRGRIRRQFARAQTATEPARKSRTTCRIGHEVGIRDAGIQGGQAGRMGIGQGQQVSIGRPRRGHTPPGPVARSLVIWKEPMPSTQGGQHSRQDLAGLVHGDPPGGSLDGDTDKPELRNRRGENPVPGRKRCDPRRHLPVVQVVGPAPGNQDIDIEEKSHGKSAMMSRTVSRVSGGWPAIGAKTIAPVRGHRILPGFSDPAV